MNRRKFIEMTGCSTIATMIPFNGFSTKLINPTVIPIWLAPLLRKGGQILFTAVVEEGVKRVFDYALGSDKQEKCNHNYSCYCNIHSQMSTEGYYPVAKESGVPNVYYRLPNSQIPVNSKSVEIGQAATFSGINEYKAFSFAKKNNSDVVNTQTVFSLKESDKKEIIAILPETLLIACIFAAIKLDNEKIKKEKIQELLLPFEKFSGSKTATGELNTTFRTKHGFIQLNDGKIDLKNGIPSTISGEFQIIPQNNTNQSDFYSKVQKITLEDENIDFLFRD